MADADRNAGGQPLWHGRFAGGPAEALMAYTVSLPFDRVLATDDIGGSRAHVAGLVAAGIYTPDEAGEVLAALDAVAAELAEGRFSFVESLSLIHISEPTRL